MKKISHFFLVCYFILFPLQSYALLNLELTQGVASAIPIAILPWKGDSIASAITTILQNDLRNSGQFNLTSNANSQRVDYEVRGSVLAQGSNLEVNFKLSTGSDGDVGVLLNKTLKGGSGDVRKIAHRISDLIYERLTGLPGIFSTKIAYVLIKNVNGRRHYFLEISDVDGYNPRIILDSLEPLMSPAFSPNGRMLSYVSFEKRHASIFLHDLYTGSRSILTDFPGINGAPAWSPDGKKLALVLSKGGSPNIYILTIASKKLTALTHDFYINTEPSWAPDGKSIVYTSNRAGGPQLYEISTGGGTPNRLTYDGPYNASGAYTPDGKKIIMLHRVNGIYSIACLDLERGTVKVLNSKLGDSSSPRIAPNGTLVLYDTLQGDKNILAMAGVNTDVQILLPTGEGDAQDPAWSKL